MHRHRHGHRNRFFGIIPLILLILGAVAFLRYYLGYFPNISWTFSPVVIIILIAVTLSISSRRRRMKHKSNEAAAVKRQSPYRQYEPPVVKKEDKDFTSAPKYQYRNSYEKQFCNYCGIKLETEVQIFCVNCGQRIE